MASSTSSATNAGVAHTVHHPRPRSRGRGVRPPPRSCMPPDRGDPEIDWLHIIRVTPTLRMTRRARPDLQRPNPEMAAITRPLRRRLGSAGHLRFADRLPPSAVIVARLWARLAPYRRIRHTRCGAFGRSKPRPLRHGASHDDPILACEKSQQDVRHLHRPSIGRASASAGCRRRIAGWETTVAALDRRSSSHAGHHHLLRQRPLPISVTGNPRQACPCSDSADVFQDPYTSLDPRPTVAKRMTEALPCTVTPSVRLAPELAEMSASDPGCCVASRRLSDASPCASRSPARSPPSRIVVLDEPIAALDGPSRPDLTYWPTFRADGLVRVITTTSPSSGRSPNTPS